MKPQYYRPNSGNIQINYNKRGTTARRVILSVIPSTIIRRHKYGQELHYNRSARPFQLRDVVRLF